MAGLELPTAGRIEIEGRDVTRLAAAERRIAMVFQSYALFPHMSVLENVSYGLVVGGARRQAAEAEAQAMLKTLGLEGLGARLPAELSGGQPTCRSGSACRWCTSPTTSRRRWRSPTWWW